MLLVHGSVVRFVLRELGPLRYVGAGYRYVITASESPKKRKSYTLKLELENVAIARHCNLRPPGLPPSPGDP